MFKDLLFVFIPYFCLLIILILSIYLLANKDSQEHDLHDKNVFSMFVFVLYLLLLFPVSCYLFKSQLYQRQ